MNISRLNNSQYGIIIFFRWRCIGPGSFNRRINLCVWVKTWFHANRFVNAFSVTTAIIMINTGAHTKTAPVLLALKNKNNYLETVWFETCCTAWNKNSKMSYSKRSNRNGWTHFELSELKTNFATIFNNSKSCPKFSLFILVSRPALIVPNCCLFCPLPCCCPKNFHTQRERERDIQIQFKQKKLLFFFIVCILRDVVDYLISH